MSNAISVTAADFAAAVVAASRQQPVVVDLWAPWCGPCQQLGPVLDQVADQLGERVILAKVDTDTEPDLAQRLGVRSIPDVRLYVDGREVDRFVGFKSADQVLAWLGPHLPSAGDGDAGAAEAALAEGDHRAAGRAALAALANDPDHPRALAVLVQACLATGATADAREALTRLRQVPGGEARADRLDCLLAMAEEAAGLTDSDAEPAATYAQGLGHVLAGRHREALAAFLAVVERDRDWRDQAARKRMLEVFSLVGERSRLAEEWRRKLSMRLF